MCSPCWASCWLQGLVVDDGIVVTENIFKKLELRDEQIQGGARRFERDFSLPLSQHRLRWQLYSCRSCSCRGFVGRSSVAFGIVVAGAVFGFRIRVIDLHPVLGVMLTRSGGGHSVSIT